MIGTIPVTELFIFGGDKKWGSNTIIRWIIFALMMDKQCRSLNGIAEHFRSACSESRQRSSFDGIGISIIVAIPIIVT